MGEIPSTFEPEERIVRILYLPKHLSKDERTIRSVAFRSPPGKDEVSVIRLEYTTSDFCKQHGKNHSTPPTRSYFGLAIILVHEIRSADADIVYTPDLPENPAHSDITIGYIPQRGEPLPSEFQLKVDDLARSARHYKDQKPSEDTWTSDELK